MESILDRLNLTEITQGDLDEIRVHMAACPECACIELIERYERLFDIIQRHIDGQEI